VKVMWLHKVNDRYVKVQMLIRNQGLGCIITRALELIKFSCWEKVRVMQHFWCVHDKHVLVGLGYEDFFNPRQTKRREEFVGEYTRMEWMSGIRKG
jgi:hypothetical protein